MSLNESFGAADPFGQATGRIVEPVVAKAQWLRGVLHPLGLASIVGGMALAGFGAFFAVQQGVSVALALMAAYCVAMTCIAGTLTMALLSQRAPRAAIMAKSAPLRPNLAAWKLVSELRVADACRLWCDIEPGSPYSQETIAWATAMLDAIKKGELAILPRTGGPKDQDEREKANPTWRTRISRQALQAWANAHGACPAFLHD